MKLNVLSEYDKEGLESDEEEDDEEDYLTL